MIKHNEFIDNSLKSKKNNAILFFKVQKKKKNTLIQKFQKLTMVKQWYQNLQYVVVKNQDLLKKKEARGVLSSLGLKTPLNKIPLLDFFFSVYKNE